MIGLVFIAPWSEVVAASEDVLAVESVVWIPTDGEVDIDERLAEGLDEGRGEADGESVVVDVLLSWRYWRGFSMSDAKERLAKRMKKAKMLSRNILKEGARPKYVLDYRDEMHVWSF